MTWINTRWQHSLFSFLLLVMAGLPAAHGLSGLSTCTIEADYDQRATEPLSVDLELLCNGRSAVTDVTWNLGDGTYRFGNPINHTYISAAAFTVTAISGRNHPANITIKVPGFLLLDDLEDTATSLAYWQVEPGSIEADIFMDYLATQQETGVANTEFQLQVGSDDGNSDTDSGYNGMIIPSPGGGGQNPFANAVRYPQGRIEVDFRTQMSWSKIRAVSSAVYFTVLDIFGLDARVVARVDGNQEVLFRLETETNYSPWISVGQGQLDSRFSVTLTPTTLAPILRLNWWLQDSTQDASTSLWLPIDSEVIGLGTRKPKISLEDGTQPPFIKFGYFYLDNFEFTQYLDALPIQ